MNLLIKKLLNEGLKQVLFENPQVADKKFFNTGKLSPEFKQELLNITHGDHFTNLVAEFSYYFAKNGNDKGITKLAEAFYQYLKEYDKNLFPVKYDLFSYSEDQDRPHHITDLYSILRERHYLVQNFKKLPSIAIRNLKSLTKVPTDQEYALGFIDKKIIELVKAIKFIPKTKKGEVILQKIFNSKNNLDTMLAVAKNYAHAFTELSDENKEDLLDVLPMLDADVIQNSDNILVIQVNDQEAMERIGCTSVWCFARPNSEGYWDDYAPLGYVYVIFNFALETDDAKFLMVYLPDSGEVYVSTNVPLSEVGIDNSYAYLKKIGVDVNKLNTPLPKKGRDKNEPDDAKEKPFVDPNQLSLFDKKLK